MFMSEHAKSSVGICSTWRIGLLAAVNWAAIWAWISSVNWVAASTTLGVIIFNVTLGVMAAFNHVRAQRLKWKKEEDEALKDTFERKANEAAEAKLESDRRAEEIAKQAAEERAELLRLINEKDERLAIALADLKAHTEAIAVERRSIHTQRQELNKQTLEQLNESAELRKQLREVSSELAQARRDLYSAKEHAEKVAARTVKKVEEIVTHPPEGNK
jgi:chromosome segregation ATPase